MSGISVNVAARRPHVALTTAHRSRSHALVGQSNNMSVDSLKLKTLNRVFVASSCEASAARSTDARTAIPPPCRGATVTATLHETGGPEDRPRPPGRARKAASRARLPCFFRFSGLGWGSRHNHKCTPQTVSEISVNAKNAQTETWFAMPFNDISTVHVFERLPMKGPS